MLKKIDAVYIIQKYAFTPMVDSKQCRVSDTLLYIYQKIICNFYKCILATQGKAKVSTLKNESIQIYLFVQLIKRVHLNYYEHKGTS